MGRKRKSEIVGTYDIDTGQARVLHDDYRPGAYILEVNGVPSSHIVPDEPRELEFEYMRWIVAGLDFLVDNKRASITHLGGAACTLARYFADAWPGSRNTVVEIDGALATLVRELFDIPRAPAVKIRVGDARAVTETFNDASRDIIIRDVFAESTTPRSLTTAEFFQKCHDALRPGGIYVANCGDHADLAVARAEVAGMTQAFKHVGAIADPAMLKGRRYGNIIFFASDEPLFDRDDTSQLTKALLGGAVPAQFKGDAWTRALASAPRYDLDEAEA